MKTRDLVGLCSALLVSGPRLVHACAVCVSGLDGAAADAYDWSVFFLMSTPYLVVGAIAGCLVLAYRRAAKKAQQAEAEALLIELAWEPKESGR